MRCNKRIPLILSVIALFALTAKADGLQEEQSLVEPELWQLRAHGHSHLTPGLTEETIVAFHRKKQQNQKQPKNGHHHHHQSNSTKKSKKSTTKKHQKRGDDDQDIEIAHSSHHKSHHNSHHTSHHEDRHEHEDDRDDDEDDVHEEHNDNNDDDENDGHEDDEHGHQDEEHGRQDDAHGREDDVKGNPGANKHIAPGPDGNLGPVPGVAPVIAPGGGAKNGHPGGALNTDGQGPTPGHDGQFKAPENQAPGAGHDAKTPVAPGKDGKPPGGAPGKDGKAPNNGGKAPGKDGKAPGKDGKAPNKDGKAPNKDGKKEGKKDGKKNDKEIDDDKDKDDAKGGKGEKGGKGGKDAKKGGKKEEGDKPGKKEGKKGAAKEDNEDKEDDEKKDAKGGKKDANGKPIPAAPGGKKDANGKPIVPVAGDKKDANGKPIIAPGAKVAVPVGNVTKPAVAPAPAPIIPVQAMGEFLTRCNTLGQLALTYSEGPSEATTQMLEILHEGKARATFFVNATWLEYMQYAGVARKAYNEGHLIGMTYRLPNDSSKDMSVDALKADIAKAATAIHNLIGQYPKYVRLHEAGLKDQKLEPTIRSMGYTLVGFNLDPADYKYSNREQSSMIAQAYQSAFSKQEDAFGKKASYVSVGYDIPVSGSAAALPEIISVVIKNNYDLVRLDGCTNDTAPYKKSPLENNGFVGDKYSYNGTEYVHGQGPVAMQNGKAVAGKLTPIGASDPKANTPGAKKAAASQTLAMASSSAVVIVLSSIVALLL